MGSLSAARFFMGMGSAPFETLVPAIVSDCNNHVHTTGFQLVLFDFALLAGNTLVSPIAAPIIHRMGMDVFTVGGGFGIAFAIFCFFFLPETSYHRTTQIRLRQGSDGNMERTVATVKATPAEASNVESGQPVPTHRIVLIQRYANFQSYYGNHNFWEIALRPVQFVTSPIVL